MKEKEKEPHLLDYLLKEDYFPRKYSVSEKPHLSPENEKTWVQTQAGFKVTVSDTLKNGKFAGQL